MSICSKAILAAILLNGTVQITQEPIGSTIFPIVKFSISNVKAMEDEFLDGDETPCENSKITSDSEFSNCQTDILFKVSQLHQDVCMNQVNGSFNVKVTVGNEIIKGTIGGQLSMKSYDLCKNQLDYERDTFLSRCSVARANYISKNCK
ncbi:hypothetical protein ORJ66_19540 [Pseudoalteromonas tunicata]|uniref:hypothetical protein n=1 Tax=Pseudoalteromonas tunicata TaxID=314281 RepID=UPI00273FFC18|nr:hypothetical protein [Pseudoalteromonas tunicata]MDP5215255.1 hypothetical protein [Pseudoalteromonas tunicata]